VRQKGVFPVVFLVLLALCASIVSGSQASKSDKRIVSSPDFPKAGGPYSEAVVAGGFVFVSGQGPFNTQTQKMELGDIKSEAQLELTNISNILKASNSSLENVVKVSVFLSDLNDFDAMNLVYGKYFNSAPPARSTVEVSRLPKDVLVEIDVIALA